MLHHVHHFQLHFEALLPFFDQWGYLIVFVTALLEGLPLIGYISPGGSAALLGGFLAREGVLKFWPLLLLTIIAAFLGDFLGFLFGRAYGHARLRHHGKYLFLKEEHIDKTQKLLKDHPGKAIVLGRFHFFTRALAPFLAGVAEINSFKFIFFAAISSFLWGSIHLAAGFLLGESFAVAARYLNIVFFVGILLIVGIFYGYRFIEARRHIFEKYHLTALILNLLSIYVFVKVLEDVVQKEWIFRLDYTVHHLIFNIWQPTIIYLMTLITNLFAPINVIFFSLVFIGYLFWQKKYHYGLLSVLSVLFGFLAEYLLKIVFGIPRPLGGILFAPDFSFPSGHATLSIIFGALIYHCLRKDLKKKWQRNLLLATIIIVVTLVGFSRIYLNVHWVSDVIGGYALGIFTVTFFILFLRWGSFFGKELLRIGRAIFRA